MTSPPPFEDYAGYTTVLVVNNSGIALDVTLNGHAVTLAATPGASTTVTFTSSVDGNDSYSVSSQTTPPCGVADGGGYFRNGGSYTMTLRLSTRNTCTVDGSPSPNPSFEMTGPNGSSSGG